MKLKAQAIFGFQFLSIQPAVMNNNSEIIFHSRPAVPVELHKVRIVQKLHLKPIEARLAAMREAGFNTFLLNTKDIFLDMLTDSGTNAMSDNQVSSMLHADDAYSGSQSFYRMEKALQEVFGKKYVLPVHQGRAAENVISQVFIRQGDVIPMNYHFTTTKAHMEINGGQVLEIYTDEALKIKSNHPFKGNIDTDKLRGVIAEYGADHVPFIRMEASTNLIGGQPFSMQNMKEVKAIADENGIMVVLDASLIGENAYFIRKREPEYRNASIRDILNEMCGMADVVLARMTAQNETHLENMITKIIEYETDPPTYESYYDPITALGWQTERWFQICSEAVGGYFKHVKGKDPVRINEVYDGNPSVDPWSTAP